MGITPASRGWCKNECDIKPFKGKKERVLYTRGVTADCSMLRRSLAVWLDHPGGGYYPPTEKVLIRGDFTIDATGADSIIGFTHKVYGDFTIEVLESYGRTIRYPGVP